MVFEIPNFLIASEMILFVCSVKRISECRLCDRVFGFMSCVERSDGRDKSNVIWIAVIRCSTETIFDQSSVQNQEER